MKAVAVAGRAGIPNDERDKKQSAGQGSQFTQEPSVIIPSFGEENLVWEDFTLLLKNSFELLKKSNRVLNFQVRVWMLLVQTSPAAANLPGDKHRWVRVHTG